MKRLFENEIIDSVSFLKSFFIYLIPKRLYTKLKYILIGKSILALDRIPNDVILSRPKIEKEL